MIKRIRKMLNILYLAIAITVSAWFLKPPKH